MGKETLTIQVQLYDLDGDKASAIKVAVQEAVTNVIGGEALLVNSTLRLVTEKPPPAFLIEAAKRGKPADEGMIDPQDTEAVKAHEAEIAKRHRAAHDEK